MPVIFRQMWASRADWPDGSPIRAQLEEFNHAYTAVLHLLHECFNGSPRLLAVATGLMYGLKDEAVKLDPASASNPLIFPEDETLAQMHQNDPAMLNNPDYIEQWDKVQGK